MFTLAGAGSDCGTAETVCPEGAGTGAPSADGVDVVVIASFFCPAAGGCTTVVVVALSFSKGNHLLRLSGGSRLFLRLI
jgi:hypothetical protein